MAIQTAAVARAQAEEARLHGGGSDTRDAAGPINVAWSKPPSRPEPIEALLNGVDRYNPQNASLLEDYLYHEQIESGTYDCLANLALLKLFQFNPDLVAASGWVDDSAYTIFLILLQALAYEPLGPDFNLCMALLADQLTPAHSPQPALDGYQQLSELASLLSARRFPQAWTLLNAPSASPLNATLAAFPAFNSILRRSIAQSAVRPTFRAIERTRLSSWLGVGAAGDDSVEDDEAELSALIGELGWTVEGDMIRIPTDPENDTKPISQQRDTIGLDKLGRLIKQSQVA